MAEYRARFSSARASVAPARREIVEFARQFFDDSDLHDIAAAAGEALANAVEHGHVQDGEISILCTWDGERLTIEVKDSGKGFSAWRREPELPRPTAPRGYGTYIMRTLMDRIEYSDGGSRLRLVKIRRKP